MRLGVKGSGTVYSVVKRCGLRYRGSQDTGGSREKLYLTYYGAAELFSREINEREDIWT